MESRGTKVILALQRWARWCANCVAPRHDSANETGNKKCLANGPASDENLHRPAPTLHIGNYKLSILIATNGNHNGKLRGQDVTWDDLMPCAKIELHLLKQSEKNSCPWSMPVALLKKEDESGGNCSKFSSNLKRTTFQNWVGSRSPLLIVT